jgi:radical SAM protein with 4Fe4S-binding SPASM domain
MVKLLRKFGFRPRVAVWELTLRCNLQCRHCGSRAGRARSDELSHEEALALCHELAKLGCKTLTLGGGEPILRPDWPDIARTLRDVGVTVNMVSNGRAWNAEVIRTAREVGLESVAFSIDGLEQTHDYIRRVSGLYRSILDIVDQCRDAGLTVSTVTMINQRNLSELTELREVLRGHGIQRWQLQLGNPTGFMADNRDLVIEPRDVLTVVPMVAKMCQEHTTPRMYIGHNIGYFGEHEESLRDNGGEIPFWFGCLAGCLVIGIESNGNVKGCLSLPSSMNDVDQFVEGNIRITPLEQIWRRKGAFGFNRDFNIDQLGGFCRTCDYAEVCRGGCAWTSFAHTGNRFDNPYCYWRQAKLAEAELQVGANAQGAQQAVR